MRIRLAAYALLWLNCPVSKKYTISNVSISFFPTVAPDQTVLSQWLMNRVSDHVELIFICMKLVSLKPPPDLYEAMGFIDAVALQKSLTSMEYCSMRSSA